MITVIFPKIDVAIMGFPPMIKVSKTEAIALARIHLGGIEGLRTDRYKVKCSTINSLCKKNCLGKHGANELGIHLGRYFAQEGYC